MSAPAASVHVRPEQYHLAWDRSIEPIATVASGDIVEFDAKDAGNGQLTATSTLDDLKAVDFSRVDQVNGPIAVEGAEPGDTLEIELLDFQPGDWGWTANFPGFGLLADDFPEHALRITRLDGATASCCPASASRWRRSAASSALPRRPRARTRPSRPTSRAATWTPVT